MKIRTGFVSNSSSASFIIKFTYSCTDNEVVERLQQIGSWVRDEWEPSISQPNKLFKEGRKFPGHKRNLKMENGVASYEMNTTMFNDWMDVGEWKFVRSLSEGRMPGMEIEKLIKTEEEYSDCYYETEFDKYCWEYDSCFVNPYTDIDGNVINNTKDKKEAIDKQEETEYDYLAYLNKTNSVLTRDEEISLAKGHLTNK